jgi:hypothetical protein
VAVGWWSVDDAHASWEDRVDFGRYAGMPARVILAIAAITGSIILGGPTAAMGAQVIRQPSSEVVVSAVAGETNNVRVTQNATTILIEDDVPLTNTSPDCTGGGASVTCPLPAVGPPGVGVRLNLGDGNDQTAFTGVTVSVQQSGGDGIDQLGAATGRVSAQGDAGNDTLTGGAGGGTSGLTGGLGDDLLIGGAGGTEMQGGPGADTFQAGAGRDVVGYCDSANPLAGVTITLDGLANDGSALEGDNVGAGIDQVSGCDAADQLTGNAGANELAGAGGDDVIDGGAGNDLINGGGGSDNLFGGDGNDTITAWEPAVLPTRADQVSCGPGVDTADVDTLDIVDSTCETITFLGGAPLGPGPGGAGAGVGAAAPGAGALPGTPPNLVTTVRADPDPPVEGKTFDVVATVRNSGGTAATGTVLELAVTGRAVPVGAAQPRQAGGLPTGCRLDATSVLCDVGTVPAGGSVQRSIAFRGDEAATLDLTANARSATADTRTSGGTSRLRVATVPAAAAGVNLPPPVFRTSANLLRASGRVLVRVPGSRRFTEVKAGQQIPFGTVVDARKGRVALVTERSAGGPLLNGTFYQGGFTISQAATGETSATLALGNFASCPRTSRRAGTRAVARAAQTEKAGSKGEARGKARRVLWGKSSGGHRTRGRSSAASVRGTLWRTSDYCNGTLTLVREGVVSVRNLRTGKVVTVRAGREYFASR